MLIAYDVNAFISNLARKSKAEGDELSDWLAVCSSKFLLKNDYNCVSFIARAFAQAESSVSATISLQSPVWRDWRRSKTVFQGVDSCK